MPSTKSLWLTAVLAVALPSAALATAVVAATVEEMTQAVPLVVRGTVGPSQAAWDPEHQRIWTYSEVKVTEALKGDASGVVLVKQPGGEVGGIGQRVEGIARFREGQDTVLFLEPSVDERGTFVVYALAAGKVDLEEYRGRNMALRHLDGLVQIGRGEKQVRPLLQRIAATQRRVARRLGVPGRLHSGAVSFTQYFGSTLQLTPHLHVLYPDGVFTEADDGAVRFVPLPPPAPLDVARIARSLARRVTKRLDALGLFDIDMPPDDEVESLHAHALQQSLPFAAQAQALAAVQPRKHHRRLAVADGFSLHADTWVHAHDRQGLERLCRYGARGPLAEERLSRTADGRYVYRLRRPTHSGATSLLLTAGQLVKRLATLLPPPRRHLTRFHGVFGPNARLRGVVTRLGREEVPAPPPPPCPRPLAPPALPESAPHSPRPLPPRPRTDWATLLRHTFGFDVLQCPCGGRRRVLAAVTSPAVAEKVLRDIGKLPPHPPLATGPPPPQLALPL